MSDSTSTTGFPRYSPWVALHMVTFILLYTLFTKADHLPTNAYTVLSISVTAVLVVISLARLAHVRRQHSAVPREKADTSHPDSAVHRAPLRSALPLRGLTPRRTPCGYK